jgi:Gpi18-like mannosyltransferase
MNKSKNIINDDLLFILAMWLSSRMVILIAMLIIAPLLPTPSHGVPATFSWDVFSAWDSVWYEKIVTHGYDFARDVKQIHTVAFFPLLPLLSSLLMSWGIPFKIAGTFINNTAFLSALILLYFWSKELHGQTTAKWVTSTLVWCPYSLYGTVIYTEGLFLLCTTAALISFEKKRYFQTAFWGALSTATRVPGLALIPAFLFVSWQEKRGIKSYIASLSVGLGILLYSLFCYIKFGDPLAFIHAQKAWRGDAMGFAWAGWWRLLMQVTIGFSNWKVGYIQDFLHPILFLTIVLLVYLLWRFRSNLGENKFRYGLYFLWLFLWLLTGDELLIATMVFGGIYLLWLFRAQIPLITCVYGFCSYLLILNTGIIASAERYAYGIVTLSMIFGLLFARYSRWGYPIICFFGILLIHFSIRFARDLWVA